MKYLSFIRTSESQHKGAPPAALMEAMGKFIEKSSKSGVLVETGGLLPTKEGVRIRVAGGKMSITDGPFAETKEVIGGWAILQGTREQVMAVAKEFMELHTKYWPEFEGESEIRPIFDPQIS